jgi:hypothetical protein
VDSPRLIAFHETERRERSEVNQQQFSRVFDSDSLCRTIKRQGLESEEEEKVSLVGAEEEDEDCYLSSMGEGDSEGTKCRQHSVAMRRRTRQPVSL